MHVRKVVGSKCVCIKGGAFKSYYNTIILLFHLRYYKREREREREREIINVLKLNNAKVFQMRADVNVILVVMTVASVATSLLAAVYNALTIFDI